MDKNFKKTQVLSPKEFTISDFNSDQEPSSIYGGVKKMKIVLSQNDDF